MISRGGTGSVNNPRPRNYVHAYDDVLRNIVTPGTFQNLNFLTNVERIDWGHGAGSADFTCNNDGTYYISYRIRIEKTAGASGQGEARLTKDGTEIAGSQTEVFIDADNIGFVMAGSIIDTVLDTEIIRVQWTGPTNSRTTTEGASSATTPISASVEIFRLC
jgi:hypothetical protein